jgi:ABC-type sugar transport system ATPase subunit
VMQKIRTLSGGNQQKVIFAKWLHSDTKVLFLDEPTKGVDVGAKTEILKMILELAKKGIAVVLISSELSELVQTCNRILIMKRGRIVKELSDVTSDSILQAELNT